MEILGILHIIKKEPLKMESKNLTIAPDEEMGEIEEGEINE
jgi:hypothetical protein